MTPEQFSAWANVLRIDPLVLIVLLVVVREMRKMQSDTLALIRNLRDEVMQLSGRLVIPDDGPRIRRRGGGAREAGHGEER